MSVNVAFLTRLSRVADRAGADVAPTAARALVDAYKHSLYDELGIEATRRPTTRAKEDAGDALDALRLMVVRAELGAEPGASRIYATARQRIEMARRALDLRIVDDEGSVPEDIQPFGWRPVFSSDRGLISAMRESLHDRLAIVASWEAIRQSRALLARFGAPSLR